MHLRVSDVEHRGCNLTMSDRTSMSFHKNATMLVVSITSIPLYIVYFPRYSVVKINIDVHANSRTKTGDGIN